MQRMARREVLLLDACSIIGLYASHHIEAILAVRACQICIADVVSQESNSVFRGGNGDDAQEREPIDLRKLAGAGAVSVISASDEDELLIYIDLLQELDDGESMTGAIAIHRGFGVVTDDRKALRVLTERGVTCETTLDLIKGWAEETGVSRSKLQAVLLDVRQRARYLPHRTHPLRAWWEDLMT